jgi:hypothetical protein
VFLRQAKRRYHRTSERSTTEIGRSAAAEKARDEDERETGRASKAGQGREAETENEAGCAYKAHTKKETSRANKARTKTEASCADKCGTEKNNEASPNQAGIEKKSKACCSDKAGTETQNEACRASEAETERKARLDRRADKRRKDKGARRGS